MRKVYVDLLTNNPRSAISSQDMEISKTCEKLLATEKTFDDLRGSVGKKRLSVGTKLRYRMIDLEGITADEICEHIYSELTRKQ